MPLAFDLSAAVSIFDSFFRLTNIFCFQKRHSVCVGYHDSLRKNGSFNKMLTEDTISLCSYGKKSTEPWKIYLTVSKINHFIIFLYFFYFQLEDTAKLVQYLGFILNWKRNSYRENTSASGNFKVSLFTFFLPSYYLKTYPKDAYRP